MWNSASETVSTVSTKETELQLISAAHQRKESVCCGCTVCNNNNNININNVTLPLSAHLRREQHSASFSCAVSFQQFVRTCHQEPSDSEKLVHVNTMTVIFSSLKCCLTSPSYPDERMVYPRQDDLTVTTQKKSSLKDISGCLTTLLWLNDVFQRFCSTCT